MELAQQIKKYRNECGLSQDELAEKIYVSRQSISNWENNKTYPDIKSLLFLSEVFEVSLDQLVKGDIEIMKKEMSRQELIKFQKDSIVVGIFLIALIILPIPFAHFFGWWGLFLYLILFVIGIYFALRVEKYKKKYDIQTYKEIVAFTEGKSLDKIEKAREEGKRNYQKIILAILTAIVTVIVCVLMRLVL